MLCDARFMTTLANDRPGWHKTCDLCSLYHQKTTRIDSGRVG